MSPWLPGLLVALGAPPTAAHPLHATLTTVVWQPETRTLELAIRVFTQDLQDALARRGLAGGSRAEFLPGDSAACGYARLALMLRDASGRSLGITSCRIERAADVTWIRLEAPAARPAGLRVGNVFLFELFADQINIVQATIGGRAQTVLFTRGDGPKPIG